MSYTNTTMDRLPLVYPLSMPVKWVDDTVDFRSTGLGIRPKRGLRSVGIQPNDAWVRDICTRVWWEV